MVPADSDKISRVPPYSGYLKSLENFVYRTITYYGLTFQIIQLFSKFVTPYRGPTTPVLRLVWAIPFSLATTKRIDCFLSFPPVTKMFQFTGLLSVKLCIHFTILIC